MSAHSGTQAVWVTAKQVQHLRAGFLLVVLEHTEHELGGIAGAPVAPALLVEAFREDSLVPALVGVSPLL